MTLRTLLALALCCSCATTPQKTTPPETTEPPGKTETKPEPQRKDPMATKLTATPQGAALLSTTADAYAKGCDDAIAKAKDLVAKLKALPAGTDTEALALYDEVVDL